MTESNYKYRKPIDKSKISPDIFDAQKGYDYFWMENTHGNNASYRCKKARVNVNSIPLKYCK